MHERLQNAFGLMIWRMAMVLCFVVPATAGADQWHKWKDDNGVVAYERKVEGSKYRETKAETTIDAPMEVLLEVLLDVDHFTKWMYRCRNAEFIGKRNDDARVFYFLQGGPMGSPDRWAILQMKTDLDVKSGACVVTLHAIDRAYQPLEDGVLRMDQFNGKFELEMLDRHRTRVRYTVFIDPGKFAPARMVKEVVRKVSFEAVQNWGPIAGESRYIQAAEKGVVKQKIEQAIASGVLKFKTPAN